MVASTDGEVYWPFKVRPLRGAARAIHVGTARDGLWASGSSGRLGGWPGRQCTGFESGFWCQKGNPWTCLD